MIHTILSVEQDERITAALPMNFVSIEGGYFVMATRYGRIKRVALEEFEAVRPSGLIAMTLEEGDTLDWVKYSSGDQDIVIVTEQGQSIRFAEEDVRVMGRPATGVNAIRLLDDDRVAGMDVIYPDHTHVLVVTRNGFGKRTLIELYNRQARYGFGVRTLARNERTGPIVAMRCIDEQDEIMLITREGVVLRTSLNEIRETGRSTQGVTLMNVAEDDEVVGVAILKQEAAQPEDMTASR
jgi:DNA gyrase subunit A